MSVISERFLFRGAGFRAGARLRHPIVDIASVSFIVAKAVTVPQLAYIENVTARVR